MSKKIKWTHERRIELFTEYVKAFGVFNEKDFNSRGKPHRLSKADWLSRLDDIGRVMGLGKDKGGALSNQIAWAFCIPQPHGHIGQWNNHVNNFNAAYDTGFFSLPEEAQALPEEFNSTNIAWVALALVLFAVFVGVVT